MDNGVGAGRRAEREIWGTEKERKKGDFWIPTSIKVREFHSEKLKIFYMII